MCLGTLVHNIIHQTITDCAGQVKKGGSYARVRLEKRVVLGTGQVQKWRSLLRHIHVLDIYVSAPPPPGPGSLNGFLKGKHYNRLIDILYIVQKFLQNESN